MTYREIRFSMEEPRGKIRLGRSKRKNLGREEATLKPKLIKLLENLL